MNVKCIPCGMMQANCYIIEDEKDAVIIDPGYIEPEIIDYIKENENKVKYILLTHRHFDHVAAAVTLRKKTGAKIVVHKLDECGLNDAEKSLANMWENDYEYPNSNSRADILVAEGDIISAGNLKFSVIETPGHSEGGVCYISQNLLFTGDTLFCGSIGRTDFFGSNAVDMVKSLKRLKAMPRDMVIYTGHGNSSTIGREIDSNIYLMQV